MGWGQLIVVTYFVVFIKNDSFELGSSIICHVALCVVVIFFK